MTGSSSRKLKRYGGDLLAGRALLGTMCLFVVAEIRKKDLRPLRTIMEDYPESRGIILYSWS